MTLLRPSGTRVELFNRLSAHLFTQKGRTRSRVDHVEVEREPLGHAGQTAPVETRTRPAHCVALGACFGVPTVQDRLGASRQVLKSARCPADGSSTFEEQDHARGSPFV